MTVEIIEDSLQLGVGAVTATVHYAVEYHVDDPLHPDDAYLTIDPAVCHNGESFTAYANRLSVYMTLPGGSEERIVYGSQTQVSPGERKAITALHTKTVTRDRNPYAYKYVWLRFAFESDEGQSEAISQFRLPPVTNYSVNYYKNADDATMVPLDQVKYIDADLTLTAVKPTRSGYMFDKWNTEADGSGTSYSPGGTYSANESVSLYAQWIAYPRIVQRDLHRVAKNGSASQGGAGIGGTVEYSVDPSLVSGSTLQVLVYTENAADPIGELKVNLTQASGTVSVSSLNDIGMRPDRDENVLVTLRDGSSTGHVRQQSFKSTVSEYSKPAVYSVDADRVNSSGAHDDEGTYAKVTATWGIAAIGNAATGAVQTSPASRSVKVKTMSGALVQEATGTLDAANRTITAVLGNGQLNTDEKYQVEVSVADGWNTGAGSTVLGTAYFTMDFMAGGHGAAFGKPSNTVELLDVGYDISSDGEVTAHDSSGKAHALTNKMEVLPLGATGTTAYYTAFARTPSSNPTGNCQATFLVAALGDIGGTVQGLWAVSVSNRGSTPTMRVATIFPHNNGTVEFGYYTSGSYFYFGVYCQAYRGHGDITVLSNVGVTVQDFGDSASKPSGWTAVATLERVNKAGDKMTGYLDISYSNALLSINDTATDLSKANNNLSSDHYPGIRIRDNAGRIAVSVESIIETDGDVTAKLYARNYNTSGSLLAQKGIAWTVNKSGALSYNIDEPAAFCQAISAWGLSGGTAIPANANLDDYKTPGNYYCTPSNIAATLSNRPSGFSNAFTMKVFYSTGTGYVAQEITEFSIGRRFYRFYNQDNGTFQAWHEYPDASTFVRKSGDTMTGSLVLANTSSHAKLEIKDGTSSSIAFDSVGAKIQFDNSDGSQVGQLIYTDYDAVDVGASLTWITNQPQSWFRTPYLRAMTQIYCNGQVHADGGIYKHMKGATRGTTPSNSSYGAVEFTDSANKRLAILESAVLNDGTSRVHLYVLGHHTSSDQYGGIVLVKSKDNTGNANLTYNANTGALSGISRLTFRAVINKTSGTGTIELSASAASYNHMRIYYHDTNGGAYDSVDVYSPNGKTVSLLVHRWIGSGNEGTAFSLATISGASITRSQSGQGQYGSSNGTNTTNSIEIVRVEAWNE